MAFYEKPYFPAARASCLAAFASYTIISRRERSSTYDIRRTARTTTLFSDFHFICMPPLTARAYFRHFLNIRLADDFSRFHLMMTRATRESRRKQLL